MSYKIEHIPDCQAIIGEGPHWDIATQSLYLVDVHGLKLVRYDTKKQKVYRSAIENDPSKPTFIIPVEGASDKFIVGLKNRVGLVVWDGVSETCKVEKYIFIVEEEDKYKNNHLNDAKCDRHGRIFTGSMNDDFLNFNTGNIYRLDNNGEKLLMPNIGLSNGVEFNYDTKKYYHVDSTGCVIWEFDYDIESGETSNPKVVFNNKDKQKEGKLNMPDGLTIDTEGYLYVAFFGGSNVLKIDPKNGGKVLLEIKLPCEQITSVAFGGDNLDILFVTTGALDDKPAPAGNTFKITGLGAKGLPMSKFRLN